MQNHILDYLDEIVKKVPEKTAFSNGKDSVSFREADKNSRAIGTWLHRQGVHKKPVIVFMRKHPTEVIAFLGVVRGGCFYVPIDEEMPDSRIRLILERLNPELMICDRNTAGKAEKIAPNVRIGLYEEICKTETDADVLKMIYDSAIDTDPVYIVFTSGTTGIPKGVAACHRSVLNYIEHLSEVLEFHENTVFGNQTPLYFDACLKEIYPTLKFGATTYLIPRELFSMPVRLVEFLNEHKINTICWVGSALTMISAFDTFRTALPRYLTTVAFGSEVFPVKQLQKWREALPHVKFTNLYGPTEGTGMCCFYQVEREFAPDEAIPIGRPFANTEIMLLDENDRPAKPGEAGEICIRGTAVTLGYYNDFERTGESFRQNPLNPSYPELIYRTGDMGKYNERGELLFLSRRDDQIKHMGHRIELGEIEANVNMLDKIRGSGCIYETQKHKIVLYFAGDMSEKMLAEELREKLPGYMMPNAIRKLEAMPLTANGKLDRAMLKKMYQTEKR